MSGSYVSGIGRKQYLLLPDMIEDYINIDNPIRLIDAFVDSLNLDSLTPHLKTVQGDRPTIL